MEAVAFAFAVAILVLPVVAFLVDEYRNRTPRQ